MKKKQFKPNTVIKHLDKDYDLGQDISVEVWKDPSRKVVFDLLEILGLSTREELDELDSEYKTKIDLRYYECASLIFVDCDVEGVDFSTPESTRAAFELEFLPWGIFHQTMLMYVAELLKEYDMLKNVLRRVREEQSQQEEVLNSGTENANEEEE